MRRLFKRTSLRFSLVGILGWALLTSALPLAKGSRLATQSVVDAFHGLRATTIENGILIEWSSILSADNIGFNVYRLTNGDRKKVNREIVPGGVFELSLAASRSFSKSFAFLDRSGTANSIYVVEALNNSGSDFSETVTAESGSASWKSGLPGSWLAASESSSTANQISYPTAAQSTSSVGTLEDQWAIAAQPALKIGIKRDGWYRVTHEQSASAGFNALVDIKNLQLYADGEEVGLLTSKSSGTFVSGDYFEFFGRGLDIATSDKRTYYLIAGTQPGKRVRGELHTTGETHPPVSKPSEVSPLPKLQTPARGWFGFIFTFLTGLGSQKSEVGGRRSEAGSQKSEVGSQESEVGSQKSDGVEQKVVRASRRKKRSKSKQRSKRDYSHASASVNSFLYTVERKDRTIYFASLLNGDTENYFGQVLTCTASACAAKSQTIDVPHPQTSGAGFARLEVALQGVGTVQHQVDVSLNNSATLGTLNYFGLGRQVLSMDIPLGMLIDGSNTITFTPTRTGTSLVDYVRVIYPHALRADNNALRLSIRPTQSLTVDGFTTQNIRLIDVTNPQLPRISTPVAEPNGGGGFSIAIDAAPSHDKARVIFAQPENEFETPAAFSLNEPSTLNATTNGADLLIIAHKELIASLTPLVTLRQNQGMTVSVVNVEDVYDEFSFGVHGPQAIKSFLNRAASSWSVSPRYVLLAGDASLDPRNYQGAGDFDMVPTKLLDATYNETSSDDWLSDFNNDGLAEIPVGRLPVRTIAETDLVVSKIISFTPAAVPQSALLIADDPSDYYFNFEEANDEVEALLTPAVTVERLNRRTETDPRTKLISEFNNGQSLVNYTGHGNVDTWMGASVFSSNDAAKLRNAVSIVISQVYGGGGEAGATLRNDFIELFNRGAWPVRLGGWSVQYASADGATWQVTNLPDVTIPPGKYFLIQQAQGSGGTTNLPIPDAQGVINLDALAGKVALVNATTPLTGTGCPPSLNVVDLVGYGAANCSLGNPVASLSNTAAALRGDFGCTDTRTNATDFTAGTPTPRNSSSAANICPGASSRLPLSFVVVMDCLNGYFQDPVLQGLAETLMKAPNGGAVAAFASSGLTVPDGQHAMATQLYTLLYGSQSIPLGDAVKTAKAATTDIDVRRTWILFGDPSMKIR